MRIIKPGVEDSSWSREVTCDYDGTIFEVFRSILQLRRRPEFTGGKLYLVALCPSCHKYVDLGDFPGAALIIQQREKIHKGPIPCDHEA